MKRRIFAALFLFAVAMVCFGILSRSVDVNGAAQVKTTSAGVQTITSSGVEHRTCIPRSALYQETSSQYYVFVLEEQAGFLGTEQVIRKVNVGVLEQDDSYVALNDGVLASQQRVVIRSDKVIVDGDKAREVNA